MKLHIQVKQLKKQLEEANRGLDDLYRYCASSKFQGSEPIDRMINRDDVFLRLDEIKRNISEAEYNY